MSYIRSAGSIDSHKDTTPILSDIALPAPSVARADTLLAASEADDVNLFVRQGMAAQHVEWLFEKLRMVDSGCPYPLGIYKGGSLMARACNNIDVGRVYRGVFLDALRADARVRRLELRGKTFYRIIFDAEAAQAKGVLYQEGVVDKLICDRYEAGEEVLSKQLTIDQACERLNRSDITYQTQQNIELFICGHEQVVELPDGNTIRILPDPQISERRA